MDRQTLQFLLVPDGSAGRRVRRRIAEQGARSGVVVGTWPELVEWARRAYLVAPPADDWEQRFGAALKDLKDAFWSESLAVAPVETGEAVAAALKQVLSATDPGKAPDLQGLEPLPERPRRHLADLMRLVQSLDGRLPDELAVIRDVLAVESGEALHTLRVAHVEGIPDLSRWQAALVEKLNRDAAADADTAPDEALVDILNSVLPGQPGNTAPGALGVVQSRLFQLSDTKAQLDKSVQWLGVRDFLQEAEVAAGMVQTLLAEKPELTPAEIGLLMPDSFEYAVAVEDAFRLGGLALSGSPAERWRRDLGREVLFHFLYCRQKPAPAMALAVCLTSPLMLWSRETGAVLAQTIMDGDYELKPLNGASSEARAMLDLLREGDDKPASLVEALHRFVALLAGGEEFAGHVERAKAGAEQLCAVLAREKQIDWPALRRMVIPRLVTSGHTPDFNLEGVTIWRESHEPWRAVRHLIVLGFAQGQYPVTLGNNPVFVAEDIAAIREATGLPVRTPAEVLTRRRERFRRQLGTVSESVSFLVPRRDFAGEAQGPSESLVFMHQLFEGPETADALVAELDAADERAQVKHLALAAPAMSEPPRALTVADLQFERDLLTLRTDKNGQPRPESPSSLETLMVSRLAWLLRRLKAEPLAWQPESANPLVLGSLAHKVFEGLFYPGAPLPAKAEIPEKVEILVEEATLRMAPFLRSAQWKVERQHFLAETTKAALAWRDSLEQLGAEVLAHEEWLLGTWCGIGVHGQTDLILGLPGERLLVVDYKRSKSSKRLTQMQKGYDSQASLYRAMLQSGGPKNSADPAFVARLKGATATGVVYYMLNDRVALTDTALPEAVAIPGWRPFEGDIAENALGLIERYIGEVRAGQLCLNRGGDDDFFRKQAGLTPYALENSPLITLFSVPAEAGDEP